MITAGAVGERKEWWSGAAEEVSEQPTGARGESLGRASPRDGSWYYISQAVNGARPFTAHDGFDDLGDLQPSAGDQTCSRGAGYQALLFIRPS